LEREAIRLSGAAVFALTAGEATAAETAEVVTKLLPKMVNMFVSEPKPFERVLLKWFSSPRKDLRLVITILALMIALELVGSDIVPKEADTALPFRT
jgi:hypothetical protein